MQAFDPKALLAGLAVAVFAAVPASADTDYEDISGLHYGDGYAYGGVDAPYGSTERYYDYAEERTDVLDDTALVSEATEDYYKELEEESDEYEAAGYDYFPHLDYEGYYEEEDLF